MPATSHGVVKINEMMQGNALSSWDEKLSKSTESNYNFLTVLEETPGRLVLASKFGERVCLGWMIFLSTGSCSSLLLMLVFMTLL